jgi:hypothetical protein|tara:strand:+ start:745 stop:1344 length:600 start_codon:yes stop_codon:yes gene_type:complete
MITTEHIKGPLGWSIGSLVVIFIFTVIVITSCISPLFMRANEKSTDNRMVALLEQYDENTATDIARFNGRSAFFQPIRIARPAPPPPKKEVEDLPPPPPPAPIGPPPAPSTYTGPSLIAIIGNEAWFRSGGMGSTPIIRLQIGEETNGLKLVNTLQPAMVTVEHLNGTYEIDLFDGEESFFRQDPPPTSSNDFLKEVEG